MKKLVLAAVTAFATTAGPALSADLYHSKAPPMMPPAPSMFDVSFGTAFTTDYILRGISQSDRRPAIQGWFEGTFTPSQYVQFYAGIWGSSMATYLANAEFDISGGVRLTYQRFGLDLGYVHYTYPGGRPNGVFDYGEFYAKPSFKVTEWLTIGGSVYGTDNIFGSRFAGWYYTGNVAVTLPQFAPVDVTTVVSGEIGRQTFASGLGAADYTTWNLGVAFTHKAMTVDLRYYDTNLRGVNAIFSPGGRNLAGSTFVATLKFDTSLSQLR